MRQLDGPTLDALIRKALTHEEPGLNPDIRRLLPEETCLALMAHGNSVRSSHMDAAQMNALSDFLIASYPGTFIPDVDMFKSAYALVWQNYSAPFLRKILPKACQENEKMPSVAILKNFLDKENMKEGQAIAKAKRHHELRQKIMSLQEDPAEDRRKNLELFNKMFPNGVMKNGIATLPYAKDDMKNHELDEENNDCNKRIVMG